MGTGFNLGELYNKNAIAASYGNYNYIAPQYNFAPSSFNVPSLNFTAPTFGSYTNWGYSGGLSSSTSSSSTSDSYEEKAKKEAEERKKRIQQTRENAINELEEIKKTKVTFSGKQREAFVKYENEKSRKDEIAAQGSLLGTVALANVFSIRTINRARKIKQNKPIKEMFFKYNNLTNDAKYAQYYKQAPIAMQEAQEAMVVAQQQFNKRLTKLNKKGIDASNITKDFDDLKKIMQKALDSGNVNEIAKATARIQAANGTKYKKLAGATKTALANAADVSKVKPVLGNKLKHHVGGKLGIAMSIIAPLSILLTDSERIKNAFAEDTKTGLKQLGLSLFKGVASGATYFFAEGLTKKFIASSLSKGAGKIAAKCAGKLAAKGMGKVIGTALGSLIPIPGINLIAGAIIGCVLDWGVRKVTAQIPNPGDKIENKNKTNEELLTNAYMDKLNGVKLDENLEAALENNKEFIANLEAKLKAQEAQMQQQEQKQLAVA